VDSLAHEAIRRWHGGERCQHGVQADRSVLARARLSLPFGDERLQEIALYLPVLAFTVAVGDHNQFIHSFSLAACSIFEHHHGRSLGMSRIELGCPENA
jgi:hypothetical protein